jgi:hypothetical protein
MRKPDRFEALLTRREQVVDTDYYGAPLCGLYTPQIVQLLRREHRAYVRLVKREDSSFAKRYESCNPAFDRGYAMACADICDALARYRKGTR